MFVKVTYKGANRKIKLNDNASLQMLVAELERCFGSAVSNLGIGYVDSDDELISISSDEDWQICVEESLSKNKDKGTKSISLQLIEASKALVRPISTLIESVFEIPASEINEEPKETTPVNVPAEDKIVEEVIPAPVESMVVEPVEQPVEESIQDIQSNDQVHVEIPVTINEESDPALKNMVNKLNSSLGNLLGFHVELAAAQVNTARTEQSIFEDQQSVISTLTNDMKDEIKSLIDERVKEIISNNAATQAEAPWQHRHRRCGRFNRPQENTCPTGESTETQPVVHRGVTCDGCKSHIITGNRYKSLTMENFDLCEACEKKGVHPGPMIRFSAPACVGVGRLDRLVGDVKEMFKGQAHEYRHQDSTNGSPHRHGHIFGPHRWGPHRWHHQRHSEDRSSAPAPTPAPTSAPTPAPANNPFNFPIPGLENLANSIPNMSQIFEGITKNFSRQYANCPTQATAQPQTQPQAPQLNLVPELAKLVHEVRDILPDLTPEQIVRVATTNSLTTSSDVVNFLLQ